MMRVTRAVAVLLIAVGGLAPQASAAESISAYSVDLTVTPEALLEIRERITYDFDGAEDRHGIQRDLVIKDEFADGSTQAYGLTIRSVTADGSPVDISSTDNGNFLSVRIGDPNTTVSGIIDYVIDYTVSGSMRTLTAEEVAGLDYLTAGDVELYWDAIGDGWGVPIESAVATVHGPAPAAAATCYVGSAGSNDTCDIYEEDSALVTDEVALDASEALTLVAAYPASAFTTVPTPMIEPPFEIPGYAWVLTLILGVLAVLLPIGFVLASRRRLSGAVLSGSPVQFEPPDSVRPAALQAAMEGSVDAAGAVATLLDLTARGHVTLKADEGGFLRKDSLTIARTSTADSGMAPWESAFLRGVLGSEDSATIQGYDEGLAHALSMMSTTLVNEAEQLDRRTRTRNRGVQVGLVGAGVVGLGLGILITMIGSDGAGFLALIPAALLLVSCIIATRLVPARETAASASFQSRAQGFKKLLDTDAATARREFAQRSGLPPFAIFATMLPYAVIFGLSGSWTQAFPEVTREELIAGGYFFGSAWAMQNFIDSAESAIVLASTEPTRESGSGFTGGSAGGGGGGGGGGSW